jgi:hypothetical protein
LNWFCGSPAITRWGYDRIQGTLANLGHRISDRTVGTIFKAQGIEPAPNYRRRSTWKSSLHAHWNVLASVDFTAMEIWTKSGLAICYLMFVMALATRRVHLAACAANPDEAWRLMLLVPPPSGEAGIVAAFRWKPRLSFIAIDIISGSFSPRTVEGRQSFMASEFLNLTGYE